MEKNKPFPFRIQSNAIQICWQYWSDITAPVHLRPNIKIKVINVSQKVTYSKTDVIPQICKEFCFLQVIPETKNNRTEILVVYSDLQYYSHKDNLTLWKTVLFKQPTGISWPIITHISWNPNSHMSWSHPPPWISMLHQLLLRPPTQWLINPQHMY